LWSFVDDKGNEQWVWLAIDAVSREIVGCYIGVRSGASAQKLWESLPALYRQCAVCYTDFWSSYSVALPRKRHRAVGKETGFTSYIERFNCTIRQRVSRLVRKTLSFSKKLENHISAIWNSIHHYNASLPMPIIANMCSTTVGTFHLRSAPAHTESILQHTEALKYEIHLLIYQRRFRCKN